MLRTSWLPIAILRRLLIENSISDLQAVDTDGRTGCLLRFFV